MKKKYCRIATFCDNYGPFLRLRFRAKPKNKFWLYARDWSCGLPGVQYACSVRVDGRELEVVTREYISESNLPDHFPAERREYYTLPAGADVISVECIRRTRRSNGHS